jgi:hypothetical protein
MRHLLRSFCFAAFIVGSLVPAFAMKNEDVIKMAKAGLNDATIILSINKEPGEYDTSPDGLIELKKAGVSDAVIEKMAAGHREAAVAEPAAASGDLGGPSFTTEVFPIIAPPFVQPVAGRDYFLRCTIRVERGNYSMTNYARGDIVPVNTPVRLIAARGEKLTLKRLDNGQDITIENVPKFTVKPVDGVARIMLSAEKTPLEKLPPDLAASIRSGEMRRGMNKEQALMARGYPPAHETPSVEGDRWVYWSSRFVKQTVVFENDRLTQGRMIR